MSASLHLGRIATLVGTAGVLLSATAGAQSVTYDYDATADFSRLGSYAWVPGRNLTDELNHRRIVEAVDAQLAAKGLHQRDRDEAPDLLVAYHAGFTSSLAVSGLSSGWGGYRFAGNRSGTARVDEIISGTLVVDLVDARTGKIVWRGIARGDVDQDASPERRTKKINQTAEKLFKRYPPTE